MDPKQGYARANAIIALILSGMSVWVILGNGFPGGSLYRRFTGEEGPSGGLTTAVRHILHGDFELGFALHASAPWIVLYLLLQLFWRGAALVWRPDPKSMWVVDLGVSVVFFAAAIYIPWWTKG